MKKIILLFIVLWNSLMFPAKAIEPVRDALGQVIHPEIAALIGKTILPQPINPKLGDKTQVYKNINGFQWFSGFRSTANFMRLYKRQGDHLADYKTMKKMYKNLNQQDEAETGKFACHFMDFSLIKNQDYYILTTKICPNYSIYVYDILKVPLGYGMEFGGISIRKNKTEIEPFDSNNIFYILLSDDYFNLKKCKYRGITMLDINEIKGRLIGWDRLANKYKIVNKPGAMVSNLDEYCGENF